MFITVMLTNCRTPFSTPPRLLFLAAFVVVLDAGAASPGPLQLAQADGLRMPQERRLWRDDPRSLGLFGTEVRSHAAYPLGEHWSAQWATAQSQDHAAVPRLTFTGQIDRGFAGGWGLGLGFRRNDYLQAATHTFSFSAAKQWGDLRGGYTLQSGLPEGQSTESHRFQLSYRHDQRNSVSLSRTMGRGLDYVGATRSLSVEDLQHWNLGGEHRLSGAFALTYDIVGGSPNSLMPRPGLRLGLRHEF
ncbi:MAG: YaiO family outer membrane beta-barrel protein [Betaproteobacteria bacterium]|jgi:YaiO family outer membrane protein